MKIEIKRLDHVQICVPLGEEQAARTFYSGVLGLVEIEKPESLKARGGLWYKIGDIQLHIGVEHVEGKSKRHPAFEVANLADVKAYLSSHGIVIKEEIPIPGINRFTFLDPFDNRIEFLERV